MLIFKIMTSMAGLLTFVAPVAMAQVSPASGSILPESYKVVSDGIDDAPSWNRAIKVACATGRPMLLSSRVYEFDTPFLQDNCYANIIGAGWQEPSDGRLSRGTIIHVRFIGRPVMTLQGNAAAGSLWTKFALYEDQPPPSVGWTPANFGDALSIDNINGGVEISHIMCLNCTTGLRIFKSGRTQIADIYGQFFRYAVIAERNYDSSTMDHIHAWPYWSQDKTVIAYQVEHLDTFILGREDDLFASDLFTFGAHSALKLITTHGNTPNAPGGSGTILHISTLRGDFTKWTLWDSVQSSSFTDGSIRIDELVHQGEAWPATVVAVISGSSAIRMDGAVSQISIGLLKADFLDEYLVDNADAQGATNFAVDQGFIDFSRGRPQPYYLNSPQQPSILAFGLQPQVYSGAKKPPSRIPFGSKGAVIWPN